MIAIGENNAIKLVPANKTKANKKDDDNSGKVDNIAIINKNSTRFVKISILAKFKILIPSKKLKMKFFIPKARLVFSKLR